MAEPVTGIAFDFGVELTGVADPDSFKVNPTIAAGDFQISNNFGVFVNLTTLPVVTPAGGIQVKVSLSAAEMAEGTAKITWIDAAGDEWQDGAAELIVPEGSVETLLDIEQGDRIETKTSLIINKVGTTTAVINKTISGSLLTSGVIISTLDS